MSSDPDHEERELREALRRQQFRLNELELAVKTKVLHDAHEDHRGTPEGRWLEGAVEELRESIRGLEARLEEHEQGMRWLYRRLEEMDERLRNHE